MQEESTTYEALFAECSEGEWRIVKIRFTINSESDASNIAKDIALLEGSELICLLQM